MRVAERKQLVIPQKFKDMYGEKFPIWSYSRVSTLKNCQHEYYLSRILKHKSEDNIYSVCGTYAHDILEKFYNKEVRYEDMGNTFEENFLDVEISDYKFSNDEDKNLAMMGKYKSCIVHFFDNHIPVESKVISEKEIWVDVNGNIFVGYVDAIHKENGKVVITDYKTSSISEFKGEKLLDKQKQLLLYALGLNQLGVPLETIDIRWNFLKYANIRYDHMINVTYECNGKSKTSCVKKDELISKIKTQLKKDLVLEYPNLKPKEIKSMLDELIERNSLSSLPQSIQDKYKLSDVIKQGERHKWIASIRTQLKKDMKEHGYSDCDAEITYNECLMNNNLDILPDGIKDNYKLEDCYVYGIVDEYNINKLINQMTTDINDINSKGKDETNWTENKVCNNDTYYCNVLCGVKKHCKYYSQYLDSLKNEKYSKEDIDILTELENL